VTILAEMYETIFWPSIFTYIYYIFVAHKQRHIIILVSYIQDYDILNYINVTREYLCSCQHDAIAFPCAVQHEIAFLTSGQIKSKYGISLEKFESISRSRRGAVRYTKQFQARFCTNDF